MEAALACALVLAVAGWACAFRARGEVNKAQERSRITEVRANAANARAHDADVRAGMAVADLEATRVELKIVRRELVRSKADNLFLLSKIATPEGEDDLLDSTSKRLRANGYRSE